jgi:hypothetical protein
MNGGVRLERGFRGFRSSKMDVSSVAKPSLLDQPFPVHKERSYGFQVDHTLVIGSD